ncbi:unnamed protein product [Caretta caretta]
MQINQPEQQVKDLNMCLAKKDKDFLLATNLADSQPALREMVKVKIAKESSSNHASCNLKNNVLKERLRKNQGLAQAWVLNVAKDIIRNGLNGLIPVEMGKALWDNATTDFERQHKAWWKLVNFTYLPSNDTIVANILTLLDAREEWIHPFVTLGLNSNSSVMLPLV